MALNEQNLKDGLNKISSTLRSKSKQEKILEKAKHQLLNLFIDSSPKTIEEAENAIKEINEFLEIKQKRAIENNDIKLSHQITSLQTEWGNFAQGWRKLEKTSIINNNKDKQKKQYMILNDSISIQYKRDETVKKLRIIYKGIIKNKKSEQQPKEELIQNNSIQEILNQIEQGKNITAKDSIGESYFLSQNGDKYFAALADGSSQASEISKEELEKQFGEITKSEQQSKQTKGSHKIEDTAFKMSEENEENNAKEKPTNRPTEEESHKIGEEVTYKGKNYTIKEKSKSQDGRICYHLEDEDKSPLLEGGVRKFVGHDEIVLSQDTDSKESEDNKSEDNKKIAELEKNLVNALEEIEKTKKINELEKQLDEDTMAEDSKKIETKKDSKTRDLENKITELEELIANMKLESKKKESEKNKPAAEANGNSPRGEISEDNIRKHFTHDTIKKPSISGPEVSRHSISGPEVSKPSISGPEVSKYSVSSVVSSTENELSFCLNANLMDKKNLVLESERNRIRDLSERKYMETNWFGKVGMFAIDRFLQNRKLKSEIKTHTNNNNFIEQSSLQQRIEGNIGTHDKQEKMGIDSGHITRTDLGEDDTINDIAHGYLMGTINQSQAITAFNTAFATTPRLRMGDMTGTDIMTQLDNPTQQQTYKTNQILMPYLGKGVLSDTDIVGIQNTFRTNMISVSGGVSTITAPPSREYIKAQFDTLKGAAVSNNISKISSNTMRVRVKLRGLVKRENTEELEGVRYDKLEKTRSEKIAKAFHRGSLGGMAAKVATGIGLGLVGAPALGIVAGVTGLGILLQRAKTRRDAIKEIAKTHEDAINLGMNELETRITELQSQINTSTRLQRATAWMGRGSLHRARKQTKILESFQEMRGGANDTIISVDTLIQRLQTTSTIGSIVDVLARIDAGHHYQTQFISTTDINGRGLGREQTAIKRNEMMTALRQACINNGLATVDTTSDQWNAIRQQLHSTPEYQSTIAHLSSAYEQVEKDIENNKNQIAKNAAGNYLKNAAAATILTAGIGAIAGIHQTDVPTANNTTPTHGDTILNPKEHIGYKLGGFDNNQILGTPTTGIEQVQHGDIITINAESAVDAVKARTTNSFGNYMDHVSQTRDLISNSGLNNATKEALNNAISDSKIKEIMEIAKSAGADTGNQRLVVERWREGMENIASSLSSHHMNDVTIKDIVFDQNTFSDMAIQASKGGANEIHRGFGAVVNILGNESVSKVIPTTWSWDMPDRGPVGGLIQPFFNTYAKPGEKKDYASVPHTSAKITENNKNNNPDKNEVKKNNRWDDKYKANLSNSISTETINARTNKISNQIINDNKGSIKTDIITTTPFYIGEERGEALINAISGQEGAFKSIIYVNGSKENFSQKEYENKIKEIKSYAANDPRIIIVGNLYDTRPTIGTIRADMIDAVDKSIDHHIINNPKIVGIDADTYKLDNSYIMSMSDKMKEPGVSWLSGKLRRYDRDEGKGDEFSFIQERMFDSSITKQRGEKNIYLSGGSFGFKLEEYKKIGGFNRNANGGEDSELGDKFIKNGFVGEALGKKIYVDPRRGQDAVNQGKHFGTQWDKNFQPIGLFSKEDASEEYKNLTEISAKLLYGQVVSWDEKEIFEGKLNKLALYGVKEGIVNEGSSSNMGIFIKRWNTQTKSIYKMISKINTSTGHLEIKLISQDEFNNISNT